MKRMHVHVAVEDLQHSIGFYSALFATRPSVIKPDYAKWMLDDPRVNFAISTRGRQPGLDHLGIQVEDTEELHEVYARLQEAGGNIIDQGQTTCCYARSEKSWIDDPAGIAWETFLTAGESTDYGEVSRQHWRYTVPHHTGLRVSVEKEERRPGAAGPGEDAAGAGGDPVGGKARIQVSKVGHHGRQVGSSCIVCSVIPGRALLRASPESISPRPRHGSRMATASAVAMDSGLAATRPAGMTEPVVGTM
jgi:predicted enzyme related to lactoylglutathione lyase